MKRIATTMLLSLSVLAVLIGAAAPASAAPTITQIQALGPPGGYLTQPNGDGGIFNLYLYAGTASQNGALLNPSGGVNHPLPDGTHTFTLRGTDQATGPTFYLNLWFNGNFGPVDIAVNTTSPVSSTTIDGRVVKVTNFTWLNSGQPNFVGVDFPSPDGFSDSIGEFTLEVSSPFPSGLVSWWRAEGNFNDSSDGNTGFPVNAVNFVPGKVGQAFSFNGSAMRVPSSANLNFGTGNFSGSMWVKTTVGGGFMVEKDIPGANGADWFVHLTGGKVRFVVGQGGDPSVTSSARVDDGVFHHLAWVRNGTSLSVYIDGALSAQGNAPFVGNVSNGVQFVIGAEINNDGNNNLINTSVSVIDEVAMFNRALSAAEVLSISGDLQPPVISLNGANPMTLECPTAYFEPGASVSDSFDPSPSLNITGTVDSHTPGTYTITYTAADDAGNTASATRIVNVVDTTAPTIALSGTNPVTLECPVAYMEAGATASDLCDPNPALNISGAVDSHTPGVYTITYTATDDAGNTSTATRTVNVVDTTAPVVTLAGSATVTVECHLGTYTELSATALDACDGNLPIATTGSVDVNTVGTYTLSYTATDLRGNAGNIVTRTVNVVDTTAPTLTLNGANPLQLTRPTTYVEPGATISDVCDEHPSLAITGSVDANTPGIYTVTYTATDHSGNQTVKTRTVQVLNREPVCTLAAPSIAEVWPPNHKMVNISILNVTDPDGDPLTIAITGITQDEPINTYSDGDTGPDGAGVGTSVAQVRAERAGSKKVPGNGRVYVISFTVTDNFGASCPGKVKVCVPHDQGKGQCIDDGQKYNSVTGGLAGPAAKLAATSEEGGVGMGNYPNPFNPATTIVYNLPEASLVRLTVYNVLGQQVQMLVDQMQGAGGYAVEWNGLDEAGQPVSGGVYFYRLEAGDHVQVRKMLFAK